MRIIRDLQACPATYHSCVIALGNFDGVHLGHQAILRTAIQQAATQGVPAAVMTFEPHPREFLTQAPAMRILSLRQKIQIFQRIGIDILFLARFNSAFARLNAEEFVITILCHQLKASHVVTGYNFAFGHNRTGNTEFLDRQATRHHFGFTACPAIRDAGGHTISSSAIRQCLAAGDVRRANHLLGHAYTLEGRVRQGQQNGHKLGFPTANLTFGKCVPPRYGVYSVRFRVGEETRVYNGVANIGVRPTFDGSSAPLLEVHGLDMKRDLYGQRLSVELVDFIRDECRFESLAALSTQIEKDCITARSMLSGAYAT